MNKLINKIKIDSYGDLRPLNESELYQQRLYNVLSKFDEVDNEFYFTLRENVIEITCVDNIFLLETTGYRSGIKISLETVESLLKDLEVE